MFLLKKVTSVAAMWRQQDIANYGQLIEDGVVYISMIEGGNGKELDIIV